MANNNNLLIVEMSSSQLKVTDTENKDYILEGIFGQIDQKNKNNRIYTESEYVPQIEALQDKIKSSKLLGELDHPQQFDISLKSVSHIIEELYYDKDTKEVRGRIKLLDTDAGRQAKALVDAGVPLQISSRAAGAVESNGKVKIKQLFTYDLVADPGFANAELKRVNESYGFDDNSGLWIYEMNGENQAALEMEQEITKNNKESNNKEKNMAEFVKAEDFNKYSEYLANEMKSIKESIGATNEDETLEDVKSHNDHIVESVNTLSEYVEYLAGKLDESIQYSEHVAEKADEGISYAENIAEKLDQGIQYSEHLAESISKVKDFAGLKGKLVNIGNPGSGQRGTMEELMKAMGVDNSFFKSTTELTSSEQVKALCDGKIDAFGYSVGFPNGAMEQAATCAAKASPINLTGPEVKALISGADYYAQAVIPKGTYTGQKKDATTFGVKATVVTSNMVEADLVYLVVKAVFENFDDFKKQHPAFSSLKKEDMIADGLSAPLHEGAKRYYKEAGLM